MVHEIEKMESNNIPGPWQGSQIREGLKQHEIFGKYTV
jgi:hypothetical protein